MKGHCPREGFLFPLLPYNNTHSRMGESELMSPFLSTSLSRLLSQYWTVSVFTPLPSVAQLLSESPSLNVHYEGC